MLFFAALLGPHNVIICICCFLLSNFMLSNPPPVFSNRWHPETNDYLEDNREELLELPLLLITYASI